MTEHVLVRSNWLSVNSMSLDLVCEIILEDEQQSTMVEKQQEANDDDDDDDNIDDVSARKTTSSNENATSITLRPNETSEQDDPIIILSVLQPDEYHIISIQLLSNARHIEFYHREYIGSCQGSRITELDSDSIYESIFEFNQLHEEITMKCLKRSEKTELIIYCLQINLNKVKTPELSRPIGNLPFDLSRVRSMIDESNLSANARKFMNDLQHMQEQKRVQDNPSKQFNLAQMMLMMKGMPNLNVSAKEPLAPTHITPLIDEMKSSLKTAVKSTCDQDNSDMKIELSALENRLQQYIDNRFLQFQQHIDDRLDRLEKQLTSLTK